MVCEFVIAHEMSKVGHTNLCDKYSIHVKNVMSPLLLKFNDSIADAVLCLHCFHMVL